MIDLHMHTTYSDGTDGVVDVLKKLEEKHAEVISITDHNTVKAYFELEKMDVSKYFTGKIIPGVELNTKAEGIPIEILGYNIDYYKMNELAEKTYLKPEKRNEIEFERLVKKCLDFGIKLDDDIAKTFDNKNFASEQILKSMMHFEENKNKIDEKSWGNMRDFYRNYMSNPSTPLYVEMEDVVPSLDEAIDLVKEAGGLVFIPHIYEYRENSPKVLEYLLKNDRIDGFECYYTTFTEEQHDYLMKMTEEKGYLRSGGSDYHGERKPGVNLMTGYGNLQIPRSIVDKWGKPVDF